MADSLEGKALRKAIKALDRSDPAVSYALELQREGYGLLAAGGFSMLGVMIGAAVTSRTGGETAEAGRYAAGLLMPLGIGIAVAGVPGLLAGQRYLRWYATHRGPPSELARLRLMNRWRRQYVQIRRNTGLLGSAFAGAATLVSGIGWAVGDRSGMNGEIGDSDYAHGDAIATLGLGLLSSGLLVTGLIAHDELERAELGRHPVFSSLQVGPGHLSFRF